MALSKTNAAACTLIDVRLRRKEILWGLLSLLLAMGAAVGQNALKAQDAVALSGPPPSTGGFFPLSQVHRGLMATAWTVFTGDKPEPMQVEILGVLRGARGPGHDMILA